MCAVHYCSYVFNIIVLYKNVPESLQLIPFAVEEQQLHSELPPEDRAPNLVSPWLWNPILPQPTECLRVSCKATVRHQWPSYSTFHKGQDLVHFPRPARLYSHLHQKSGPTRDTNSGSFKWPKCVRCEYILFAVCHTDQAQSWTRPYVLFLTGLLKSLCGQQEYPP